MNAYKKLARMTVEREKRLDTIARELGRDIAWDRADVSAIQFTNWTDDLDCRIKINNLPF